MQTFPSQSPKFIVLQLPIPEDLVHSTTQITFVATHSSIFTNLGGLGSFKLKPRSFCPNRLEPNTQQKTPLC